MILVAVGLHVDSERRVLVQERVPGDSLEGLWEFPGGKVLIGETLRAALKREWEEELGLQIGVGALITECVVTIGHNTLLLPLFEVFYDPTHRPKPLMGQKIEHIPFDQLLTRPGTPSMSRYAPDVGRWIGVTT